jgi:tetratricopeptide (TPR) repeat protein
MAGRKVILPLLIFLFTASLTFGQTEVLKSVVNNLAFYRQKKDVKYLSRAKTSVDSLIKTHADSADMAKNIYKAVVYSSIAFIDSLNTLKQPANFFDQTCKFVDQLGTNRKAYKYQTELDYSKRCLANVYLRRGFAYMQISDYYNAISVFQKAKKYAPDFKEINGYIAYANNKVGNLVDAGKYYTELLKTDSTKAEYIEAASNTYKAIGDTDKALQVLQKGRRHLPNDKFLLLDEANIYNNRRDYKSLEPLLSPLLDQNTNSGNVAFVAANCYDHLNEFDKAESLYLHSIELNSSEYDPVYNLGILYYKLSILKHGDDSANNLTKAGQWLERANEMSPNDVKPLQLLQLLYTQTGNQEQIDKINSKLKLLTNQ